jgi:hypothetical protein
MNSIGRRPLWMSRCIVLLPLFAATLALTLTPLASAQVTNAGGLATGGGTYNELTSELTVNVTGTPQAATGLVTGSQGLFANFTGEARCISIDETDRGYRASIAGVITGGNVFAIGQGFRVTVYDNTPGPDELSDVEAADLPQSCSFDLDPVETLETGAFIITPTDAGTCPTGGDEDRDGLRDDRESIFSTLLRNADSDRDGIVDGNDDSNGNGEDDEDEDDDEDDGCPDEDSDGDGEDDEDEDDD